MDTKSYHKIGSTEEKRGLKFKRVRMPPGKKGSPGSNRVICLSTLARVAMTIRWGVDDQRGISARARRGMGSGTLEGDVIVGVSLGQ